MRTRALLSALALSTLALSACGKADAPAPAAQAVPPGEVAARPGVKQASVNAVKPLSTKKFGGEITEQSSTALNALMKEPTKFTTKTVKTEGVVSAVCQEQGCWMEITDEAGQAHIKMAGHSFFIPKEASGHRAVIQGKVLGSDKDHCAEEAEAQTGKVAKVQIEATGVQFLD